MVAEKRKGKYSDVGRAVIKEGISPNKNYFILFMTAGIIIILLAIVLLSGCTNENMIRVDDVIFNETTTTTIEECNETDVWCGEYRGTGLWINDITTTTIDRSGWYNLCECGKVKVVEVKR